MRTKALTLALLMIVSALAGCIEGSDEKSDSTDDVIVDDRSGNGSAYWDAYRADNFTLANSDDCNSGGGTWIEASERGGESYCDIDAEDVQRVVCELTNETWLQTIHHDEEPCERGVDNDCDGIVDEDEHKGHSHSHSHGDVTHSHTHTHGGYCETENPEVLEVLKNHCEIMGGNWTAPNSTAEQNRDNGSGGLNEMIFQQRCVAEEPEISADECELRGGTWKKPLCVTADGIVGYALTVVYPDDSSDILQCRGCIDIDNMTVWNLTTTVLSERNISMNYSTHEVGHNVSGINGSGSPSDGSWHWTLYVWNETDAANASWEESRYGGDYTGFIEWSRGTGHIAWAPNTTNISDIPVPRNFVENTDGDSEMTQEDCERRGGTWTEATDREGVHYCDFEEDEREDDREESNDDSDPQADCEERGGTWAEETRECSQES